MLAWNFLAASVFWYIITLDYTIITLHSSLISWAVTIINTINTIIQELVKSYDHINTVVEQIVLGAMGIGTGGFLSTILQFGIDQLYDASTNEISAFIVWYMWTCGCPPFIMNLTSYSRLQIG